MIIEYSKEGISISDWEIENYILDCIKNEKDINTSNELLILVARVFIKEEKLDYKTTKFLYDGFYIRCDKYGTLENWPDNFCNRNEDYLMRIIDWIGR